MNHNKAKDRIYDYLKNEMAVSEKARFELHLAGCAECWKLHEELKNMQALLTSKMDHPPDGMLKSIKTKAIAAKRESRIKSAWRMVLGFDIFKAALPVAATALLLTGLFLARNFITISKPPVKAELNDFLLETYSAHTVSENEDYHARDYMNEIGL